MSKSAAIRTPIHQDAFALDPASQATLRLINEVSWSFSILFGRGEGRQIPIVCDADGNLNIVDSTGCLAELLGQLDGSDTANSPFYQTANSLAKLAYNINNDSTNIKTYLRSTNDVYTLANYFDSTNAYAPLYSTNDQYGLADYFDLSNLHQPLYDSSYSVAYWLKEIYDLLYSVISGQGGSDQVRVDTVS